MTLYVWTSLLIVSFGSLICSVELLKYLSKFIPLIFNFSISSLVKLINPLLAKLEMFVISISFAFMGKNFFEASSPKEWINANAKVYGSEPSEQAWQTTLTFSASLKCIPKYLANFIQSKSFLKIEDCVL